MPTTISEVEICNMALTLLGADRISSLTEVTPQAATCSAFYTNVRDALLEEHPWNFATKRAALIEDDDAPTFGYGHAFQLPSDYIRILRTQYNYSYRVENNYLLSDESTVNVEYIARITNPNYYSRTFIMALAAHLAVAMCYKITNSRSLLEALNAEAATKLLKAKSTDAQEGTPQKLDNDVWCASRYSNGQGDGDPTRNYS